MSAEAAKRRQAGRLSHELTQRQAGRLSYQRSSLFIFVISGSLPPPSIVSRPPFQSVRGGNASFTVARDGARSSGARSGGTRPVASTFPARSRRTTRAAGASTDPRL